MASEASSVNASHRSPQLLENAVKFLQDPQVRTSSVARQVEFLEGKGLSRSEIEEAMQRAGINSGQIQPAVTTPLPPLPTLPPPSLDSGRLAIMQPQSRAFDWGKFALVIALVGSAGMALSQSFIIVGLTVGLAAKYHHCRRASIA